MGSHVDATAIELLMKRLEELEKRIMYLESVLK